MSPLLFIVGPTGVGKTKVAIQLALALGTEVISADSRQIYRGMDIGTAKPTRDEQKKVGHYMIDILNPDESFSVGEYRRRVLPIIEDMQGRGMMPLIVGGTGLYVKGILYGLCPGPQADWSLRKKLLGEEEQFGEGYLYKKLTEIDPEAARRIKQRDKVRIIRALEVFYLTGNPISNVQQAHSFKETGFTSLIFGLSMERRLLYRRIEERTDNMISEGLIEEVKGLLDKGYNEDLNSMQGLGYRHIVDYLRGRYDLAEAIRLFKRDTKRYAKRQFTWFRKEKRVEWVDIREGDSAEVVAELIKKRLKLYQG